MLVDIEEALTLIFMCSGKTVTPTKEQKGVQKNLFLFHFFSHTQKCHSVVKCIRKQSETKVGPTCTVGGSGTFSTAIFHTSLFWMVHFLIPFYYYINVRLTSSTQNQKHFKQSLLVLVESFSCLFAIFALCNQLVQQLTGGKKRVVGILCTPT